MLQWYLCRYSLSGMPWLVPIVNELLAVVAQEKEKKGEKNEWRPYYDCADRRK